MSTKIQIVSSSLKNPQNLVRWALKKFPYMKAKKILQKQYGINIIIDVAW